MARLKAPQAKIPKPPIPTEQFLGGGTLKPVATAAAATSNEQKTLETAQKTGLVDEQWGKSLAAQPQELLDITKQTPKALFNFFGSFVGLGFGQPAGWAKKSGLGWAQNVPLAGFAFSKAAAEQATSIKETAKDIWYIYRQDNFPKYDKKTGQWNLNPNTKRDRISQALQEGRPVGGLVIEDLGNIALVGSLFTRGARLKADAAQIKATEASAKAQAAGAGRQAFEDMAAEYADDAARWRDRQARWGKRTRAAERVAAAPIYAYTVPLKATKWAAKASGRWAAEFLRDKATQQERAGATEKASTNRRTADQLNRFFGTPMKDSAGNIIYQTDEKGRTRPVYVDMSELKQWGRDRNRRVEARAAKATREGLATLSKPYAFDEINPQTGEMWGPLSADEQAAVMAIRNGRSTLLRFVQDALPEFTLDQLVGMGSRSNDIGYNLTPEGARIAMGFERGELDLVQMRRIDQAVSEINNYIETYLGQPARQGVGTSRLDPTTGEYRRDPLDPYQDYPVPNVERFRQALIDTPMGPAERAQATQVLEILDRYLELGLSEMPVGDPLRLQLIAALVEAAPDAVIGNTSIWPAKERNRIEEIKAIREDLAQRGATQVIGRPFPEGGPGGEPQPLTEDPVTGLPTAEQILTRRLPGELPRSGMAYMKRAVGKLKKLRGRAAALGQQVADAEIAIDAAERQIIKQRMQLQEIEGYYVNEFGRPVFPDENGNLPRGARRVPGLIDDARRARDEQLALYNDMVAKQQESVVIDNVEVSRETIAKNVEVLETSIAGLEAQSEAVTQAVQLTAETIGELQNFSADVAARLSEYGVDAEEIRVAAQQDLNSIPDEGPLQLDLPEELSFVNTLLSKLHDLATADSEAMASFDRDIEVAMQQVIDTVDQLRASGELTPEMYRQLYEKYQALGDLAEESDFNYYEMDLQYESIIEQMGAIISSLPAETATLIRTQLERLLNQIETLRDSNQVRDYFYVEGELPDSTRARQLKRAAAENFARIQIRQFAGDPKVFDVNYDPALKAHVIRHRGLTYIIVASSQGGHVKVVRMFDIDQPNLAPGFAIAEGEFVRDLPKKDLFANKNAVIGRLGETTEPLKKNVNLQQIFDAIKNDVARISSSDKPGGKTPQAKPTAASKAAVKEAKDAATAAQKARSEADRLRAEYDAQEAALAVTPAAEQPTAPPQEAVAPPRMTLEDVISRVEAEIATGRASTSIVNKIKKLLNDRYTPKTAKERTKALDSDARSELVGRGTGRAWVAEADGQLYFTNSYYVTSLEPGDMLHDKVVEQGLGPGKYESAATTKPDVPKAPLRKVGDQAPNVQKLLDDAKKAKGSPAEIVGVRAESTGDVVVLNAADGTAAAVSKEYLDIVYNDQRTIELTASDRPVIIKENGKVVALLMPQRLGKEWVRGELLSPEEKASRAIGMITNRSLREQLAAEQLKGIKTEATLAKPAEKPKLAKPKITEEQVRVAEVTATYAEEAAQQLQAKLAFDQEKAKTATPASADDAWLAERTKWIDEWRSKVEAGHKFDTFERGYQRTVDALNNQSRMLQDLIQELVRASLDEGRTVYGRKYRNWSMTSDELAGVTDLRIDEIESLINEIDDVLATYQKTGSINTSGSRILPTDLRVALTDNPLLVDAKGFDPAAVTNTIGLFDELRAVLESKAAEAIANAPAAELSSTAKGVAATAAQALKIDAFDKRQYREIAPGITEFNTGTRTYRIVKRERPIKDGQAAKRRAYDYIIQRVASDGQTIESTTLVFKTEKAYKQYINESIDIDAAMASRADAPIDAPALMPPRGPVWPKDLIDAEARLAKTEGKRVSLLKGLGRTEARLTKLRTTQAKNRALLDRTDAASKRLEARLGREVITQPGLSTVEGVPAKPEAGLGALVRPSERIVEQEASVAGQMPESQLRAEVNLVAKSLEEAAFLGRRQRVPISMAMRASMSRRPQMIGELDGRPVEVQGSGYVPARSPSTGEPGPKKVVTEGLSGFRKLSRQRYRTGEYSEIYDIRELIRTVVSEQRAMDQNEAIAALMSSAFAVSAVDLLGEQKIDQIKREAYDYTLNELDAYKAGRLDRDRYFDYRVQQQVGLRIREEMAKRGWVTNPGEYTAIDRAVPDQLIRETSKFLPKYAVEAVARKVSFADPNAIGGYLKTVRYGTSLFKNLTLPLSITWQLGDIISTFLLSAMTDVPISDLIMQMRKAYEQNYGGGIREIFRPETDRTVGPVGQYIAESGLQDVGLRLEERSLLAGIGEQRKAPFSHRLPGIGIVPRGYGRFREAAYRFNEFTNRIGRQAYFMARLEKALKQYNETSGRRPIAIEDIAQMRLDETNAEVHRLFWDTINQANDVMGDWMDLNSFERRVVMPHVTFYAWIKHINKLFARLAMNDPAKIMWYMYVGQMAYDPDTDPFGIFGGLVGSFLGDSMARVDFAGPLSDVANGPIGALASNIFARPFGGGSNEPIIRPAFSMFSPVPRLLAAVPGLSMRRGLQPLQRPPSAQVTTRRGVVGQPELNPLSRQGRSELLGVTIDTFPLLRKIADIMPTGTIPGTDVQLGPYKTYETGYARTKPGTPMLVQKPGGRLGAFLNLFNVPFRPSISRQQLQEENLQAIKDVTQSAAKQARLQAIQDYING